MDEELMEYPRMDNVPNYVDQPSSSAHLYTNEVTEAVAESGEPEAEEWQDEVPEDDMYTTLEQDEAYELNRWANWTKPVSQVTHAMLSSKHWELENAPREFYTSDAEFFDCYEDGEFGGQDDLFKQEFWRRKDRDWCFACAYSINDSQSRMNKAFAVIQELIDSGIHTKTLNDLCHEIQDCFMKNCRQFLPREEGRPLRYWHVRSIRDHLSTHVPTIAFDVEQTMRDMNEMSKKLRLIMFKRSRVTGQLKVNTGNITSWLRIAKERQGMYRFVSTVRNKRKKV